MALIESQRHLFSNLDPEERKRLSAEHRVLLRASLEALKAARPLLKTNYEAFVAATKETNDALTAWYRSVDPLYFSADWRTQLEKK